MRIAAKKMPMHLHWQPPPNSVLDLEKLEGGSKEEKVKQQGVWGYSPWDTEGYLTQLSCQVFVCLNKNYMNKYIV